MVMRTMRKNFAYLKYLIILVLAVFIGGFALQLGKSSNTPGSPATVNGKGIPEALYSKSVQAQLEQLHSQSNRELLPGEAAKVRRQVLDALIEQTLVSQAAVKMGMGVSDEELSHSIQTTFRGQDGRFDQGRYMQYLQEQAQQGVDQDQSEEAFRQQVLFRKVRMFLENNVQVSQAEIDEGLKKIQRQVRAKIALLLTKPLQAKTAVTEEELKDYYSQHRQSWAKSAQVKARHILIKVDAQGGASADLAAKSKAEGIYKEIKAGGDFAELAKKNSQDPGTAKKGGDLGFFGTGMMVPEFERKAFEMKPGGVSEPVKSQFGYHIIKVEDKKAAFEPTFENSRAKAKEELTLAKARQEAVQLANKAADRLAAGASLENTAKELKIPLVSTGWFDRKTATLVPDLGKEPSLAEALLDLDKGGHLPSAMTFEKGAVLAELTDEKEGPARKPDAKDLKDVTDRLKQKKTEIFYEGWVASLKAKAKIIENTALIQ